MLTGHPWTGDRWTGTCGLGTHGPGTIGRELVDLTEVQIEVLLRPMCLRFVVFDVQVTSVSGPLVMFKC